MTETPNADNKPFLMGSETEYAVSAHDGSALVETDAVYDLLSDALRQQRRWMPDRSGSRGSYFENGSRLYLDYGSHPEYATPECSTPAQVACHDKAGEELLRAAREQVLRERLGLRLAVVKNNLDPLHPDQLTYGTHESYTCWAPVEEAARALIPHLVSRVIYAGSGGLTAHPQGTGFELSQRARHLVQAVGADTTSNRAVFSTRVRKTSDRSPDGWVRVHLIGKDSQRAPLGTYLTFATTGLLIEMLNRGRQVGQGLELADPIQSLRRISRDPWLRVRVALRDGRRLSALEIQTCYLEECERAVQHGGLPEWAPEALRHWRETLAALAAGPLRLADRLDPYCKLLIYEHELLRADYDWGDLREALQKLAALRSKHSEDVVGAVLAEDPSRLSAEACVEYGQALAASGANQPRALERLRFAVRLQALDVHYHELGGLYDRLYASGRMQPVVVDPADIDRATHEPPPDGRAAARAACIKGQDDDRWAADWQYLWHAPSNRCVDLRNPFASDHRLVTLTPPAEGPVNVLELLETAAGA